MTTAVIAGRALPSSRAMSIFLVVVAAGLTALAAQWRIQLPFTPVPITGSTFAVLLTGAALGWRLGGLGQLLYLGIGVAGVPVFTNGTGGVEVIRGATGGYIIGFVLAAAAIGWLAERRQDRTFSGMFTAFLAGSAIIYICGVIGLMGATGWPVAQAVENGVVPFLLGDLVKAGAAGLLLPTAWRLLAND